MAIKKKVLEISNKNINSRHAAAGFDLSIGRVHFNGKKMCFQKKKKRNSLTADLKNKFTYKSRGML